MGASVLVSVTKFSLRLDVLTFCTEFRTKCFYLTSSNLMISPFKNSLKDILSRNVSIDADSSVAIYYSRVKEVVVRRCPVKKNVLEHFSKFTGKRVCRRPWHRCLPVSFAIFLFKTSGGCFCI